MTEPSNGTQGTNSTKEKDLDQSASAAAYRPRAAAKGGARAHPRRFWSQRRVPAGLLAAAVIAGAGVFLYDIAAVRAGRPGMQWRKSLAGRLDQWRLDDIWVLVGAGVAVALGVLLIVLAVTPGLRRLLPMRRDDADADADADTYGDVRAALDRAAAELVLRDRAMEVSGVQSARVRMRRHRVAVSAVSHFRELDDVRADLDAALDSGIRELALVRPPALTVRVRRPAKKP
ncbi:DUF6286 domain-containing protein [Streptomyces sp. NPDC000410]|uniref:DUF6286 domain-containing protein n=1 Tax=Streptomyces sp. NPDC000410 TaxID=3154254 RepID=UPI00332BA1C2